MAEEQATTTAPAASGDGVSIRLDLATGGRVGPGKVAVLEAIAQAGSISAAGRVLGMSYRRTWTLVENLNHLLGEPVVQTSAGGSGGGGAGLTETGKALVACYRAIEAESTRSARQHLAALYRGHGRK
jgi:molybdate transport system regulatory protein